MNLHHTFDPDILKACDVRGIVRKNLDAEDAYFLGRAFGTLLRRDRMSTCALARDGRLSSPGLAERFAAGLLESGVDLLELGIVPTPALYFALNRLSVDAGVVVTASHNPPEYNGFKYVTTQGPFHGRRIQELAEVCRSGDLKAGAGSRRQIDIRSDYVAHLHSHLLAPANRELSIVWDPGNGAVAAVLEDFLRGVPGRHTVICDTVDGRFPNHHPDPNVESNLLMLKTEVRRRRADLGIAFDGDGDRIGVVDGNGERLAGDQLLTLFARELLRTQPGARIMSEVKASRLFYDEVLAHGGDPVMWKVGHTNQKEKMRAEGIPLAGETSGHIFFAENNGYDDALFAAVKLINILSRKRESLAEIRSIFPTFHDSGELRIRLEAGERERLVAETRERLDRSGRGFVAIDGIRAECQDGFWLMRSSNTEPHITVRCEARTREGLERCVAELRSHLEGSGLSPDLLERV